MNTQLQWDGDALVLIAGPWRVWVAYVEEYGTNANGLPADPRPAQAFLYGWGTETSDLDLNAGAKPDTGPQSSTLEVMCRTRAEATTAIRALYAMRGIDVPPAPWEGAPR